MPPSWELQGGDQSPLLPVGVGLDWGLAPGPYLWPFLVSWSIPPMNLVRAQSPRKSEHQSEREPRILSGGTPPCLSQGSFTLAQLSHQSIDSGGWHCWNLTEAPEMLQKPVLEKPSTTLGELENSGLLQRPRGVDTQSSEPQQRG